MGKDNKDKTESPFEEEGLLDDKCEACCGRCCYAPPPFRVALVPTIFLLAVFVVLWGAFRLPSVVTRLFPSSSFMNLLCFS